MISPWVEAMKLPVWDSPGFEVPSGYEVRGNSSHAALHLLGTDKVVGFVPSRFDPKRLPELLARLGEPAPSAP